MNYRFEDCKSVAKKRKRVDMVFRLIGDVQAEYSSLRYNNATHERVKRAKSVISTKTWIWRTYRSSWRKQIVAERYLLFLLCIKKTTLYANTDTLTNITTFLNM